VPMVPLKLPTLWVVLLCNKAVLRLAVLAM
jgi:hypothetical protein